MRALIDYIMRGRREAIIAALIFSLIPLLGWMGVAIMALVTLRQGPKEGFIVVLWLMLASLAVTIVTKQPLYFVYDFLLGTLVVWLFAIILSQTESWLLVLQTGVGLAIAIIATIHLLEPNIASLWLRILTSEWQQMNQSLNLSNNSLQQNLEQIATMATGLQAISILISNYFNLAMGRWMQATKYNPGGLNKELSYLRLDKVTLFASGVIVIAAFMGLAGAVDMMPVICLPFVIYGGIKIIGLFRKN